MHQPIGSRPAPRRGPQSLFSSLSRNLKPNGPCVHEELAKFQVRKLDLMYTKRWNNKQKGAPKGGPSSLAGPRSPSRMTCWCTSHAHKGTRPQQEVHDFSVVAIGTSSLQSVTLRRGTTLVYGRSSTFLVCVDYMTCFLFLIFFFVHILFEV